jgi:hypothetical protein
MVLADRVCDFSDGFFHDLTAIPVLTVHEFCLSP